VSTATELADLLVKRVRDQTDFLPTKAAAELRRLDRVNAELVEALGRAYTKFGDFRMEWAGRHTMEGQSLLSAMRDALALAERREDRDVQDDYCTRAALTSATKETT
jgi:hypothetical protein